MTATILKHPRSVEEYWRDRPETHLLLCALARRYHLTVEEIISLVIS
jgi:hypothetical protein